MASAVISVAASGDNTIVAAPGAGKFIRVRGYVLKVKVANDVTWKGGATALTGAMGLNSTDSGLTAPVSTPDGWFDCGINTALVLNLSAAQQVSGHVLYSVHG